MREKISIGKHEPIRFNLMVAGESGLGKSTFIHTLLSSYLDEQDLPRQSQTNSKTIAISRVGSFQVDTDTSEVIFHLYDSPGYGDHIDNQFFFDLIRNDLIKRHKDWRKLDGQLLREEKRLQLDTRIHCILYFLSPHRIKDIDIEFINQLSDVVVIIPIIAKADCMTNQERQEFLVEVSNRLDELSSAKGFLVYYDFNENLDDNASSEDNNANEFNVINDNLNDSFYNFEKDPMTTMNCGLPSESFYRVGKYLSKASNSSTVEPNLQPLRSKLFQMPNIFACVADISGFRKYIHGIIDIKNENYSDFRRFQRMLFEEGKHIQGLKELTQEKTIQLFQQVNVHKRLYGDSLWMHWDCKTHFLLATVICIVIQLYDYFTFRSSSSYSISSSINQQRLSPRTLIFVSLLALAIISNFIAFIVILIHWAIDKMFKEITGPSPIQGRRWTFYWLCWSMIGLFVFSYHCRFIDKYKNYSLELNSHVSMLNISTVNETVVIQKESKENFMFGFWGLDPMG